MTEVIYSRFQVQTSKTTPVRAGVRERDEAASDQADPRIITNKRARTRNAQYDNDYET
jgi:hypothetical protein